MLDTYRVVTANMTLLATGADADASGSSFTTTYLNRLNAGSCLDFSAHNTTPPDWSRSFAFDGNQSIIHQSINQSCPTIVCSWLTIFALLDARLEIYGCFLWNSANTLFSAINKNTTMPVGIKRRSDMKKKGSFVLTNPRGVPVTTPNW
jgi:hypothetical protein